MFGFSTGWKLLAVVLQIALINVVLSGDNAVVIALACRSLPPRQQKLALTLGAVGLVVLMSIITACASYLLTLPFLELLGSLILLWIGVKLLLPDQQANSVKESQHLIGAVTTIIIADIVMSLDNVLGMAGAAEGHLGMLVVGLVITIPLILFCSATIMKLMQRFPILVTLGGALLGYVAGEMAVGDPSIRNWIVHQAPYLEAVVPLAGAVLVVSLGKALDRRGWASRGGSQ
jgi:YjbE family integral membrane protein